MSEPKYEYLIEKREDAGIKHVKNLNALIVYSNTMDDVYEDIENYNPERDKKKVLIVFDDIIANITIKNFRL